jgi:tetratricopeptide (TPR) repeat protein
MSSEQRRAQLLEAYERDQPAVAIELARLYLAESPDDRTALLIYGDALAGLARYPEARAAFEKALELSELDQRATVLRHLGRLYDQRGELREAERYYRDAIASSPQHGTAYIYLGAMLARAGRLEEAEGLHREATECSTGEVHEAYLNLALVQRGRGDYFGALKSLRQALALDPTYEEAQNALIDIERVLFEFPPLDA